MLFVAIFCTAFSMMIFRQAIVAIGSVSTTILSTLEPITVVILSLILFDESFNLCYDTGGFIDPDCRGTHSRTAEAGEIRVKNDETL